MMRQYDQETLRIHLVFMMVEVEAHRHQHNDHEGDHRQQEHEEVVVVLGAHAVVHPGAVVVEALHAPVADRAVPGSGGADHFTVGTQEHWVESLKHFLQNYSNEIVTKNGIY